MKRDIEESKMDRKHYGKYVLLEYNCPIIHIAELSFPVAFNA